AQAFRSCRRQWGFAYQQGLRPRYSRPALTWGKSMHAGLEAAYQTLGTVPVDEVIGVAKARARVAIADVFRRWVQDVEEHGHDVEIAEFYEETRDMVETVRWAVPFYLDVFAHDFQRM